MPSSKVSSLFTFQRSQLLVFHFKRTSENAKRTFRVFGVIYTTHDWTKEICILVLVLAHKNIHNFSFIRQITFRLWNDL